MISQRCPKCNSNRIRRGYRPTPIWSKIVFRYNLLCDGCNWEFTGFAVPGTVSAKPTRKKKTTKIQEEISVETENSNVEQIENESETPQMAASAPKRIKKTYVL